MKQGKYKIFSVFGIELEYMIVNTGNLNVSPVADRLIAEAAGKDSNVVEHGLIDWSNELVKHVVEVKNPVPGTSFQQLVAGFEKELKAINQLLEKWNCCLLPSSMHPWMDPKTETQLWPLENNEIYSTYDRLFDCRKHGFANLQSMHINLPFQGDAEFEQLHSAVRFVLPLIPFLAASSPFIEGKPSQVRSERLLQYLKNQKTVPSIIGNAIPDYSTSQAHYMDTVLEVMYRDVQPLDPDGVLRGEWLNSRAAIPKFEVGCIEIRVSDINECPRVDLALAEFWICLVRRLVEGTDIDQQALRKIPTLSLRRIFDQAIAEGFESTIKDPEYLAVWGCDKAVTGKALLNQLLEESTASLSAEALQTIRFLLEEGTLSERLTRNFQRSNSLESTYRPLVDCLKNNTLYE